jgi:hypothetical protein
MVRPDTEWYRARAAECTALEASATDPRVKAFSKTQADGWLRLAELVEKQNGPADKRSAGGGVV